MEVAFVVESFNPAREASGGVRVSSSQTSSWHFLRIGRASSCALWFTGWNWGRIR